MARTSRNGNQAGWGMAVLTGVALTTLAACGGREGDGAKVLVNPVSGSGVDAVGGSGGDRVSVGLPTITIVSERSHQPVPATVVARGSEVEITAPGFLPRRQPAAWSQAVLWEDDFELPYDVSYALVYKEGHLERPPTQSLTLSVDPGLEAQRRFRDAVSAALDTIARQTPYSITRTDGPAFIEIRRGAARGFLAYLTSNGSTIQGARIEIDNPDAYWGAHLQRAITHEIGHVFGFLDCDIQAGVMCAPEPVLDFSPHEQELLRKMVQRNPGNIAPDSEPTGMRTSSRTTRRVCMLPPAA